MSDLINNNIVEQIKILLEESRQKIAVQVNTTLINTYWQIGKIICEYEQVDPSRAEYGKHTLKVLSKELTKECGKGFMFVGKRSDSLICISIIMQMKLMIVMIIRLSESFFVQIRTALKQSMR